ncbi:FAD-binding oxidoreductase [Streptomyces sp. NPDC048606]|uniref:FAD-binding oxidoreductase n=1 Tax=Streptomyces sp. NPDC048606 TaxID=3154726 RepID=UPI003448189A
MSGSSGAAGRPRDGREAGAGWGPLQRALAGHLSLPGTADYERSRLPHNARVAEGSRPEAIAYCAREADVARCLDFARSRGVGIGVRSGGHCFGGCSSRGPLVIDVSRLAGVRPEEGLWRVGAGTRQGEVYGRLARSGVAVAGGTCPGVGFSGLALGGGHGVFSRARGLTCDAVVGARVVLADGRVVECGADREPDLWWAVRGGGHAVPGVVTSLLCRAWETAPCTVFALRWESSATRRVPGAWQEWASGAPAELWSQLVLGTEPGGGAFARVRGVGIGPGVDVEDRLAALLREVGPGARREVRRLSFVETVRSFAGMEDGPGTAPRWASATRSHYLDGALDEVGAAAVLDVLDGAPREVGGAVALTPWGGRVRDPQPRETAFWHRRAAFLAQCRSEWDPAGPERSAGASARTVDLLHAALAPYGNGHAYPNYTDPALADAATAYHGGNLPRLREIGAHHDPDGILTRCRTGCHGL